LIECPQEIVIVLQDFKITIASKVIGKKSYPKFKTNKQHSIKDETQLVFFQQLIGLGEVTAKHGPADIDIKSDWMIISVCLPCPIATGTQTIAEIVVYQSYRHGI
jgi:hypothetical protein